MCRNNTSVVQIVDFCLNRVQIIKVEHGMNTESSAYGVYMYMHQTEGRVPGSWASL